MCTAAGIESCPAGIASGWRATAQRPSAKSAERCSFTGKRRVLRAGGVPAVDNVLSHPDEVAEFLALIESDGGFVATTVAVGKRLHVAWRRP